MLGDFVLTMHMCGGLSLLMSLFSESTASVHSAPILALFYSNQHFIIKDIAVHCWSYKVNNHLDKDKTVTKQTSTAT